VTRIIIIIVIIIKSRIQHHDMITYRGVEVNVHALLTLALAGVQLSS